MTAARLTALTFVAALGLLAAPAIAWAEAVPGPKIDDLVRGKRIYLAVPLGGEFPLFYRADGRVDGTGEALGLGRAMRPKDSGRWWVSGDRLCQRWTTWYDGKTLCFTLRKTGAASLAWTRDDGLSGTARIGR